MLPPLRAFRVEGSAQNPGDGAVLFHGIHNCNAGRDVCGADGAVRPAGRKNTVTASDKFGSIIIRISN